jgi:hypothetical protein
VLDLYARCWQGEPLGEDDYVISADEKSHAELTADERRWAECNQRDLYEVETALAQVKTYTHWSACSSSHDSTAEGRYLT